MMEHECVIGLLRKWEDSDLVNLRELIRYINDSRELAPLYANCGIKHKIYELSDYGDKRKSTDLIRFEYCPECGKKIDWSAIKKMKVED